VQGAACRVQRAVQGAWCRVRGAAYAVRVAGLLVVFWSAAAGLGAQVAAPAGSTSDLPDGDGVGVVRARCLSCHGADLITAQRLADAGWGRELDKMVRWGAIVPEAERPPLVAYLATHFGPAPVPVHAPAVDGEAVFTSSCLSCHGADLTEQQRLTPLGWTREVEKMMRWGAQVSDAEKAALVAYLAARYPVR
jgi:mono/diheme cytochrome c family protein